MAKRRTDLIAFYGKTVPDIIAPQLRVLFCGINPSLTSAAEGYHFATPGNRFWPSLFRGGFTPEQLSPKENRRLLDYGLGVTNLVARATTGAAELGADEYQAGVVKLERKCRRYKPAVVAVLGVGAYRVGFSEKLATIGPQTRTLGETRMYVLPNPSGLNAHYSPDKLSTLFKDFRAFLKASAG